jgi:hypothetical protein
MTTMERQTNEYSIIEPSDPFGYYVKYAGQCAPQKQYVEIDFANRTICYDTYGYFGAQTWSPAEFDGFSRRVTVPLLLDPSAFLKKIKSEVERLTANYDQRYNGQKYVGIGVDKIDLDNMILNMADDEEQIEVWDAADWYSGVTHRRGDVITVNDSIIITDRTTDAELKTLENDLCSNTEYNQMVAGTSEWLEELRDSLQ